MSSALVLSTAPQPSPSPSSSLYLHASPPPSPQAIHTNPSPNDTTTEYSMRFLPPPPPSTASRKHTHRKYTHPGRRRDCYQRLQIIIQENERIEREEYETMLRKAPSVVARRSPSQERPSILVRSPTAAAAPTNTTTTPPDSPTTPSSPITPTNHEFPKPTPRQSVRFATEPPKVFQCSPSTSPIAKLRNFLHLFSD